MGLEDWGWDSSLAAEWEASASAGLEPARVTVGRNDRFGVALAGGEGEAFVAPALRRAAASAAELPCVGDWVGVRADGPGGALSIHLVLPRRSRVSRRSAGREATEQVLAANVDDLLILASLDREFNPRRIERYLIVAAESGARPHIVLNKIDLCEHPEVEIERARQVAAGAPVWAVSALEGSGLAGLSALLQPGRTLALLGSSGVGKSTLLNHWIGREQQATGTTRDTDGRGRHTTTRRELVRLPGGALLLDTPGLREIQIWAEAGSVDAVFPEIDALAPKCRYRDCTHSQEPGCAVLAAVEAGEIETERLDQYRRLRAEQTLLDSKLSERDRAERRRKDRVQGRMYRRITEQKRRRRLD